MSQLTLTLAALRSILAILSPEDQRAVLGQINREHGIVQTDVPRMYQDHEIANRYNVHVRTVREWIATGRLKGCKIDRYWYSRADWLEEFDLSHAELLRKEA